MTGEVTREFVKHKVYGSVVAVERDENRRVLTAILVSEATTCRHRLNELELSADEASVQDINDHPRDYEPFEPKCSDPTHLLADIGEAEKECQAAESEWQQAHSRAKGLKDIFEDRQEALRQLVRDATAPKRMPLFDQPAA